MTDTTVVYVEFGLDSSNEDEVDVGKIVEVGGGVDAVETVRFI